jgi:hypothetical protein
MAMSGAWVVLVGSSYRLRQRQARSFSAGRICTRQKMRGAERLGRCLWTTNNQKRMRLLTVPGVEPMSKLVTGVEDLVVELRTWNLLITDVNRSQAPCHWATRPSTFFDYGNFADFMVYIQSQKLTRRSLSYSRGGISCPWTSKKPTPLCAPFNRENSPTLPISRGQPTHRQKAPNHAY